VPDDEINARFARLERDVSELREQVTLSRTDAAAARVLAAGADRDVSEVRAELRAHTQALNALRETQLELRDTQLTQGRKIDDLGQEVGGLRQEMRGGFATVATGMAQITALLTPTRGPEHDG
jgi:chromosome segregation ATPase